MTNILIVEDEAIVRDSLKDWVMDSGYGAEVADQGEKGLELIEQKDFDLMLLDLRLPGKDGLQVLREARQKKPDLQGVIITAYPEVNKAVEAMKLGALDFLTKPLDLTKLDRLIQETVSAKRKPLAEADQTAMPALGIQDRTNGGTRLVMSNQEAMIVEEASRRAYEPFAIECDYWAEAYCCLQDHMESVGYVEKYGEESEDEEDFGGLEINLGESRYWRAAV